MFFVVVVAMAACGKQATRGEGKQVPVVRPEAPPEKVAGVVIPEGLLGSQAECTCGSKVDVDQETFFSIYEDRFHFFCCGHCKSSFDKDPAGHLKVRDNGVAAPEPR